MIKLDIRKSEKCSGENSIFISFPYDADIIDILRAQTFVRYWIPENKEWEFPIEALEKLLLSLSRYEMEINVEDIDVLKDKDIEIPKGFKFKTAPYEHQIEGVKYGIGHERWLLGDEQGLGKTKEIIDLAIIKKMQNNYKHCLIICCVNGLKWNWQGEIKTHSDEYCKILGSRITKTGREVVGSINDRYADLENIDDLPYFIITNVESLRSEKVADKLSELCDKGEIGMIAADEMHMCKNASAQQSKGFLKLHSKTMVAMTGTPLMNSPLDLYVIFKWLGYENHSFYSFKNHYCVMGGYGGYEVVEYKNLDELQSKLNDIMLRRLKKDVLDLPEKTRVAEYVEMTAKQSQVYKEVMGEIAFNLDKIKTSNNPLAELIRLRQATGYTGILSSTIQESAKLDRMEELVEEAVTNGNHVVIFSNWTNITDAVFERLNGKYKVSQITGETKDEDRDIIKNDFQDGKYDVLIGTTGAMGTGLTLTMGTIEIFMDEPWNRARKEQAEDRCHRIGQSQNLTIYTLLTKNTIDERIHEIVYAKGEMSDIIVDGKVVGDKGKLVDYLLS